MSRLLLASLLIVAMIAGDPCWAVQDSAISFNNDIRPILSSKCIACHGPDEEDRQADLRLDTFEGATDSGAVVPGEPDDSSLIDRISSDDEEMRMPPVDHGDPLSLQQIELLRRWIAEGGNYETHWAFVVPRKVTPPEKVTGRVNNEIDSFVLAGLEHSGLSQNAPAEPRNLVRRLSLDLTGLPPNVHAESVQAAIGAYLEKPHGENYSALVDQLLATPAYGEHWASMWLDIARYADTVGYSGDENRDIWPWRDWLIRNINENKSYRQFTTEMLAGDLLPNPTEDQKLATAFHRNTLSNNEGGTNDEEFRTIAVKDRISTTVNAFMGLTIRCAECHTHKYDPISHKEYYQFLDFFNQTVDSDHRDDRPKLEVYPAGRKELIAKLRKQIAALKRQRTEQPDPWKIQRPIKTESREGTKFEVLEDDSILATGPSPAYEEYRLTFKIPAGEEVRSLRVEVLPHERNGGNTGRIADGAFIISQFRLTQTDGEQELLLLFADAAADYSQVNRHIKSTIKAEIDGKHFKQGWAVNHQQHGYRVRREGILTLKEPLQADTDTEITLHILHDAEWPGLNVGCVRIATTSVDAAAARYREKKLDPLGRKINEVQLKIEGPVRVPVLEERPEKSRRETHVMARGNFESKLEKVTAAFPSQFHPMPVDTPANRLGVAEWIFADENPLTARVAVNRYWARLFGIGIVETEEDFGTQGTPPTHPQLLDWLAVDFQENDWNVKRLLKQVVTSATYRQDSTINRAALEQDSRNRLLSRGPRLRMSAEVIRDQALAVSGLLTQKLYGPPVYPPSPIKRIVNAFTGGMNWVESVGEDRYRRTLYTYLKRSQPHPLLETFDMATRDVCSMRRLRTNTPLQSFVTLNDIMFIEAARSLADKVVGEIGDTGIKEQIEHALRQALFMEPNPEQVEVLCDLYDSIHAQYEANPSAAAKIRGRNDFDLESYPADSPERKQLIELASLTVVSNVILNLDEFLNN